MFRQPSQILPVVEVVAVQDQQPAFDDGRGDPQRVGGAAGGPLLHRHQPDPAIAVPEVVEDPLFQVSDHENRGCPRSPEAGPGPAR